MGLRMKNFDMGGSLKNPKFMGVPENQYIGGEFEQFPDLGGGGGLAKKGERVVFEGGGQTLMDTMSGFDLSVTGSFVTRLGP